MSIENPDEKVEQTTKETVPTQSVLGGEILVSGEEIITEVRSLLWPRLVQPLLIIISGIAIYYLAAYLKPLYLETDFWDDLQWLVTVVMWFGPAVAIVGLMAFIVGIIKWRYTIYVLTNKRIVRRTGVLGRSYLNCSLSKVQNVELNMPLFSRIFKFGTIRIATARTKGEDIEWTDVRNPIALQRQINEALEEYMQENIKQG